jgi:hypothetical protein
MFCENIYKNHNIGLGSTRNWKWKAFKEGVIRHISLWSDDIAQFGVEAIEI